ncbi:hypothetical protein P3T16_005663 [Paraburkholderia sp. GAS42]
MPTDYVDDEMNGRIAEACREDRESLEYAVAW